MKYLITFFNNLFSKTKKTNIYNEVHLDEPTKKTHYHIQVGVNNDPEDITILDLVNGDLPEKGKEGIIYIGRTYSEIFLWSDEASKYIPVASLIPVRDVKETIELHGLPLIGDPGVIYGLRNPLNPWLDYYKWDSETSRYKPFYWKYQNDTENNTHD